jgi:hypothetical protein
MRRCSFWCLLGICSFAPTAYAVQVLGCNRLELILDSRLNDSVVQREWASGHVRVEAPASLELRGCKGQLLDRLTLDAPLARLDPVPLRGTPAPTYLVSVDLSAEAGSFNGPLTFPIQVKNHHLQRVEATASDGNNEPIRLALTGKAAWKKIPVGSVDDFLSVSCQPQGGSFVIFYRRYHPTRHGWEVRMRSEPGFWESDGEFPNVQLFPADITPQRPE